ncbi:recombinase RecT [Mesorhizobium sp. UC22_110]|uniref:recombinase RecT n=1 Tax=unclassified Mesorhizobium TaxID=325217 RepID=UPI0036706C17
MNQLVPADQTSTREIGIMAGAGGASIAPQNLGEVVRFAEVMCRADIALPKHLRGNAGACMAVALQAMEWNLSPFAVASKSYAVNGAIAYEAQLIAAVVNTRSGIQGRLKYFFEGEGSELTCRVVGILDGEECEYTSPTIGSITTKNSPLWKSDPQQQLGYFSARSWARRHCPEVILGVYDREEVEQFRGSENARDVTPTLADRLKLAKIEQHEAVQAQEGFSAAGMPGETAALTGEPASTQSEDNSQSSDTPADDNGSDGSPSPEQTVAAGQSEPADEADEEEGAPETDPDKPADGQQAASSSEPISAMKRMLCEELVDNMLRDAFSEPAIERPAKIDKLRNVFLEPQNLGDAPDFVNLCHETARRVIGKPGERDRAHSYLMAKIPAGGV